MKTENILKSWRTASKKYYEKHKQEIAERRKLYAKQHPERRKEIDKKWFLSNLEKAHEKSMRWFLNNIEKSRESSRKWNIENKEKYKANKKKWNSENLEKSRIYSRNRRALKTGSTNNGWSSKEEKELKESYGNRCVYCGKKIKLTMDHIVPLSKGGQHSIENVVPACQSCNSKKSNKSLLVFMYRRKNAIGTES